MNHKSSTSTPSPIPASDPSPRNPRVHRQSGIPSISRPRTLSNGNLGVIGQGKDGNSIGGIASGTFGTLKKTAHHLLQPKSPDVSAHHHTPSSATKSARRRFASMPQPSPSPSPYMGHPEANYGVRGKSTASPPIVDFTTFEDTYRGPRSGTYEGLMVRRPRTNTIRNASEGFTKPGLKRPPTPSASAKPIPLTGIPLPASARKPDPRLILSSLENVFGDSQNVEVHLNAHDLLAMHQLDEVDFEDRARVRAHLIETGKLKVPGQKGALAVLGEPIRKASIYASTSMVLAGREHELPVIVVNTVEELYRTGIYQTNLFRTLPNRARLLELIDIYDSAFQPPGSIIRSRQPSSTYPAPIPASGFGSHTSLHLESTPDICALLTTYLSSLSEPVLPLWLFRAIWDWCELDDEDDMTTEGGGGGLGGKMQRQDSFGPRISHIPLARTYTSPTESTHILVAQLLLQLLPSPNFSLLVYLLAFFSQAALVREENGVGVPDLSRMFGGRIFGGDSMTSLPTSTSAPAGAGGVDNKTSYSAFNTTQTRRTGETMMSWFLRRWGPLSEGLFDVVDDAKMGLFHRTVARRDSLGKDILPTTSWPPSVASSSVNDSASRSSSGSSSEVEAEREYLGAVQQEKDNADANVNNTNDRLRGRDDESYAYYEDRQRTSLPRIHLDGVPLHSTPKANTKGKGREVSGLDPFDTGGVDDGGYVVLPSTSGYVADETLDITQLPSRISEDVASVSSTAALDERLMDISLPTVLNSTLPISQDPFNTLKRVERADNTFVLDTQRHQRRRTKHTVDREVQTIPLNPVELVHALQLTAHLESQLEERTNSLTSALKELTKSKLAAARLGDRVCELEVELAAGARAGSEAAAHARREEERGIDAAGFQQQLAEATRERDHAQDLVSEIKKLIRN